MRIPSLALIALTAALRAPAQDMRQVTEPKIPPACTILTARLASHADTLAEADETHSDTLRIQQAMDRCKPGHSVELKPLPGKDAFLTGPLELRTGVTLLVDKGTILFASRNPRDYDIEPGLCGTVTEKKYPYTQGLSGHECKPLIGGHNVSGAAIMGDGIIDGRRFAKLLNQPITWEDLAEQSIMGWPVEYTRWARAVGKVPKDLTTPPKVIGLQNNPRLITLVHCDNFTLYRIQLRNSPNFAVSYAGGNGFTVWGVIINVPRDALNGDGINLGQPWPEVATDTTNVTIAHSFIYAGDDNLAIKSRTGSVTTNISVLDNHFYAGHGIGTGSSTSGGISHVLISGLTLDGTSTGINMKSNDKLGGLVQDVTFNDICIRNSPTAISIGTHSGSDGHHEVDATDHNKPPQYTDIVLSNILIQGGGSGIGPDSINPGSIGIDGLDAAHRLNISFQNVLGQPAPNRTSARHADIHLDATNFTFSGEDITLTGAPATSQANNCDGRFVPFPAQVSAE